MAEDGFSMCAAALAAAALAAQASWRHIADAELAHPGRTGCVDEAGAVPPHLSAGRSRTGVRGRRS